VARQRERWRHPDFIRELRARVWAWDPVALVDFGPPEDEYDCLVTPISGWLRADLTPEAMADRLQHELASHFGSSPPADTLDFATSVVVWYQAQPADSN
jgi:hypothetical protein